ncbi:type III secretion system chaperone family protein [Achromobacter marplatensis]|uniref:hypothetical protein n=1 Tax=Achromobacter marplatensis TaxID=470868 RepID=UPI0039F742A7
MNTELLLNEFTRHLGLPDVVLDRNSECAIELGHGQYLGMQCQPDAILLYIAHPLGVDDLMAYLDASKRAHLAHLREDAFQLALREMNHRYWLLALSRIPAAEFSALRGERACADLRHWLQSL